MIHIFSGNTLYITNNLIEAFPFNQKYYWRVRSENKMGVSDWSDTRSFTTSSPTNVDVINAPEEFNLSQNYPNPFNPGTKIKILHSVEFISIDWKLISLLK